MTTDTEPRGWDFLSEDATNFATRAHEHFPDSFSLAKKFSDFAMGALRRAEPKKDDNHQFIAAVLFGRAITSFQAAYILTERGLLADARTIVRGLAETSIVLNAHVLDREIADILTARHHWHSRKLLSSWLRDPQAVANMTSERKTAFETQIANIDSIAPGAKAGGDPLKVATLAEKYGLLWLYNTVYRMHSGDAAHASLNALERHVNANSESEILTLNFGPETRDIRDTVSAAIAALIPALNAVVELFEMDDLEAPLAENIASWQALGVPANGYR